MIDLVIFRRKEQGHDRAFQWQVVWPRSSDTFHVEKWDGYHAFKVWSTASRDGFGGTWQEAGEFADYLLELAIAGDIPREDQ